MDEGDDAGTTLVLAELWVEAVAEDDVQEKEGSRADCTEGEGFIPIEGVSDVGGERLMIFIVVVVMMMMRLMENLT